MSKTTFTCTRGDARPYYAHDCDTCKFLGSFLELTADRTGGVVYDTYACGEDDGADGLTVIMRASDDGPDYSSLPLHIAEQLCDAGWVYVVERAKEAA